VFKAERLRRHSCEQFRGLIDAAVQKPLDEPHLGEAGGHGADRRRRDCGVERAISASPHWSWRINLATCSYVRTQILPAFGDIALARIEHPDIQEWVNELSERLAPTTLHKGHQILRKTLAAAVRSRLLVRNPCESS
jgi:hypothetical protein